MPSIADILQEASKTLHQTSPTPRLDAEVLIADALEKDRGWLLSHPDVMLQGQTLQDVLTSVKRRFSGEPVAYITNEKEFYGRSFYVDNRVLVPRPESESFISLLLWLIDRHKRHITEREKDLKIGKARSMTHHRAGFIRSVVDIGTGSGCLAVTAALECKDLFVTATDVSDSALHVAIKNARSYDVPIVFKQQDLLSGDKQGYDVVMANLPYVPDALTDSSIACEPAQALYGGIDGLDVYRQLFKQLSPKHIRFVLTEALIDQHVALAALAADAGYAEHKCNGLVQLFVKHGEGY